MTTPAPARDVPRPGADSSAKRAARVADRIVEDVMAAGWPVGRVLGSEAELLERYQVSRAVFREAVRLVEHLQVARTRRGPGGGLVVIEPTFGAVIDAVVLYLHRVDARLDEVFEARVILEGIACRLASERADEGDRAEFRRLAESVAINPDHPGELHVLVASVTRNPALELFVHVLNRVALLYSQDGIGLGASVADDTFQAHVAIAELLLDGDAESACARMRAHLEAEAEVLRRRRSTRQLLPDSAVLAQSPQGKGAQAVARNITRTIVALDLQPGALVGTEPELIEREGVSRALLREAVRLLEHHQIARMRRGPGGGLFVVAPSADAVTEVAAIYLAWHGMKMPELSDLRIGVEVATVELAAARVDPASVALLHDAMEREQEDAHAGRADAVYSLHAAVAEVAQNRVLHLVALVLIRLSLLHQAERLPAKAQKEIRAEVLRTHRGITEAIEARDENLAGDRMRKHLEALSVFMR
jgi:DNA-binding FadR family transcriptional regulator